LLAAFPLTGAAKGTQAVGGAAKSAAAGSSARQFGVTKKGNSFNPVEWIASSRIAERARSKGLTVERTWFTNSVEIVDGKPIVSISRFAHRTAAVEEYLQAQIAKRALASGMTPRAVGSQSFILPEEIRVKTRLLGGLIKGLDNNSLEATREEYIIQMQTLNALRGKK